MAPSAHPASVVSRDEVTVVAEPLEREGATSPRPRLLLPPPVSPGAAHSTLQNRISSIFNNLPNDIELSDDSASETESVGKSGNTSGISLGNDDAKEKSRDLIGTQANSTTNGSTISRLPSRRRRTGVRSSPSSSNFYTLKSFAPPMTRKISSNFSSAILGGAKSILNTNLAGVASSTTSMVSSISEKKRRKKRKPRKLSDNPLKNGGMPKKYWMNDAFVADCLNCFKPFTAFRRKHHCRFCGQIFCSDCTLFISYSHYKNQRQNKDALIVTDSNNYRDKLRVCKACYSDVVVYLSDDSMSSCSESDIDNDDVLSLGRSENSEDPSTQREYPLARYRTLSITSRKNSVGGDMSLTPTTNRAFLNNGKETEALASASPAGYSEPAQRSPEGISYKQAPQMAIPTTRTGQAVEIPLTKSSTGAPSSLKSNLTFLALKNASNANMHLNPALGADMDMKNAPWYIPYAYPQAPVTGDSMRPNSLENLSLFYKSMVNYRYGRIASNSDKYQNQSLLPKSSGDQAEEEDFESENEDEQVMSLYTSLNHSSNTQPSISPRPHNVLSTSMSSVPTLHEFPNMVADDKYLPTTFNKSAGMMQFDFGVNGSTQGVSINEDRLRSDRRSNARAKASLRRIRGRRTQKFNKNKWSGHPGHFTSSIENGLTSGNNINTSSFSPLSSTPRSSLVTLNNRLRDASSFLDSSQRQSSHEPQGMNATAEHTQDLQYSLDEIKNGYDSHRSSNPEAFVLESLDAFETNLSESFNRHIDSMITQCLADCDINDPADQNRWSKVLTKCLSNMRRIKISDTLDVKQYVKVKKILGGKIEDTDVLDGLFITKNIDSKRMSSYIENPKIALLVFPIEYLKQKEQFISLRIVDSQQSVFISNLVSRLISLEPDIIVVGDTVCGLAERLLEEANITVLSNVKPQAVERISRYTNGDIFQSVNDLFLKKSSLGSCRLFEVKRFLYKDTIKTYSFFTGSNIESGFTICLRGGDEEFLSGAKYATETLIPGFLNSRLEQSFFMDCSLYLQKEETVSQFDILQKYLSDKATSPDDLKSAALDTMERLGVCNYIKLFETRYLSVSPSVEYPLPPVLANVVETFQDFSNFYDFNSKIQQLTTEDTTDSAWFEKLHFAFNLESFSTKEDVVNILKFMSDEMTKRKFNEFNFRSRLWANCMKYTIYQLYPIFHKSIHFLHSTVSIKHATPCHGPLVVVIDYYTDNDKSLGLFLDQIFQESNKLCDECGEIMLDHFKTYAHDNGKIDLIVEKVENLGFEDTRHKNEHFMWSYCPECDFSTPITALSDETYSLSLGKFFELCFWSQNVKYQNHCPHDFFKKHIKYFGRNGLVIRMEYNTIDTYEVVVPKKKHEFVSETDIKLKLEAYSGIEKSASALFQSVAKRLNRVKVDTFDKAEDGSKKVEELKERLRQQEDLIASKTFNIYNSTSATNYLSLNVIQRNIQELGVQWESEFNDFEQKYLPTENEITRITQFHLRNLLMDKLHDDLKSKTMERENTSKLVADNSLLDDAKTSETDENKREPGDGEDGEDGEAIRKDNPPLGIKLRVPLSLIEDKIMQIKQSFENDLNQGFKPPAKSRSSSIADLSIFDNSSVIQGVKKVQDLTNYFNQMTLEFQRQREETLERNLNKYKATPVANSKPIVEIYDNIEDVVDVKHDYDKQTAKLDNNGSHHSEGQEVQSSEVSPESSVHEQSANAKRMDNLNALDTKITKGDFRKDDNAKARLDMAQPEKNSLLKSLSNFWADRSATSWDPLEFPLDSTEHTFADNEVIVREDEPSSLVAFCLYSDDYKQKLSDLASNVENQRDILEINDQYKKKLHNFTKIEKKFKKNYDTNSKNSELESAMTKEKSSHLKFQFVDGNSDLSCKIFYSEQFEAFRKACGIDDSFIQSLSRCVKWDSKGGKSGSNFLKTLDNRYILKELSKTELESFVSIAPFYFKYMSQSTFNTLTTAIAKIFGFYQVEIRNSVNGKIFKMDFLIMENLFFNRTTTRIFDLKGSMRNRHVKQTGKENEVLLDENMIEFIYERPVFVKEQLKKLLRGSLFNDTSFLSAMDVMDYSLVIGIDEASHKLYVGIIDWLRTFTWDKKVENWVKGTTLVGKKGKDPTIVTPKQYRTRFREAMDRYILEVPDIWYEGNTQ